MTLRFGVFELDLRAGELRKHGVRTKLQEQPFQILARLLERPGELVTRDELRRQLWPAHTYVDFDRSLNKAVNKLRLALGDGAENPRFIETVPRHGYRFIAPAEARAEADVAGLRDLSRSPGRLAPAPLAVRSLSPDTGMRRKVWAALIIALAALLLAALATPLLQRVAALRGASAILKPRRSIAVLDFQNLSGRPDDAWLSTALRDWLTTELAAGGQLRAVSEERAALVRVVPSLPDLDLPGQDSPARIHKSLAVDLVVVGAYASLGPRFGGQLRLDLQLADARSGETIVAIAETGTELHLFELVARAGARLRHALGIQAVTPEGTAEAGMTLPANPAAERIYSEGLAKLRVSDAASARELFQKAVALEPSSAPARSALAMAWSALGYDDKAEAEARMGFELSSNLPAGERLLVEGRYRQICRDWEAAIEAYRALHALYPDNLDCVLDLAGAQVSAGRGKQALATLAGLRNAPLPVRSDPRINLALARAAESQGDFRAVQAMAASAAEEARVAEAPLLLAQALNDEAWALANLGQPEEAAKLATEAKQLIAGTGDRKSMARALTLCAISLDLQGDAVGATKMFEESLQIFRQLGNKNGLAVALNNTAGMLREAGDLSGARQMFEESLAIYREIGYQDGMALAKSNLGDVLLALGDLPSARTMYEESLRICRQIGDKSKAAGDLAGLGNVLRAEGDLRGAVRYEMEAVTGFEEIGDGRSAALARLSLAQLLIEQGNGSKAIDLARRAAEEFEQTKAADYESVSYAVLARASLSQRRIAEAREAIDQALAPSGRYHDREAELFVGLTAARVRAASANPVDRAQAEQNLLNTLAEATTAGFVDYGLQARLILGEIQMSSGRKAEGRACLTALEREAVHKGFNLIAQQATAALRTEWSTEK